MSRPRAPIPAPLEADEQKALLEWAERQAGAYPSLRLLYHIENEGRRTAAQAARAKAMGLKKGVPDLCLPAARCGYHALYIELKRTEGGRLSNAQRVWRDALGAEGNLAVVCRGWEEARDWILAYLRGRIRKG